MSQAKLSIVICTHNRAQLLRRTLEALCEMKAPDELRMNIIVVANACSDGTRDVLKDFQSRLREERIQWVEEQTPGKSVALNRAIALIDGGAVAFVDDDQRPAGDFLVEIEKALLAYPDAQLFCGRLLPEWTGSEPGWVHDNGRYRVYPAPIPADDAGPSPRKIDSGGPIPAGGNLIVRAEVFSVVGGFNVGLGPRGHNLGGGEDQDFILRCLRAGAKLQYAPGILQYHYVDPERLTLRYLISKSFERTRAALSIDSTADRVPPYLFRKVATYAAAAVASFSVARRRFYLIRLAAALGEFSAIRAKVREAKVARRPDPAWLTWACGFSLLGLASVLTMRFGLSLLGPAAVVTAALNAKSLKDFTRTGPQLKDEILSHYVWYSLYAFLRLSGWVFVLCLLMGGAGLIVLDGVAYAIGLTPGAVPRWLAALTGIAVVLALQFCKHLLHIPGSIAASSNYRLSRFYPLWRKVSPRRLRLGTGLLGGGVVGCAFAAVVWAFGRGDLATSLFFISCLGLYLAVLATLGKSPEPGIPKYRVTHRGKHAMNVLMIGADTLRADRLGIEGYARPLTPALDNLARRGVYLSQCYVPCARTAPSLASLLTGTWPHTHGIRDNFALPSEASSVPSSLARILSDSGYKTIAISDWAGSDLGKYPFGFERRLLPSDQWNIKYLIRQGPKDMRLFLSLFTHSRFGKWFLPELYYLAGIPMTDELGRATRTAISDCAVSGKPFFINTFFSTTHAPFATEYPYYTMFADKGYNGASKFVMGLMNDPFEIIKQQRHTAIEFDLNQIYALYDGCVRRFDDEVKRIIEHLGACALLEQTLIVIYSDHGIEFFERDSWGQGNSVIVDESSRIPVIIVDPRKTKAQRIDDVTRNIDIAPTILDLLELPVPAAMEGESLKDRMDGRIDRIAVDAFEETGIWFTRIPGLPEGHLHYPDLPELLEIPDKAMGTLSVKREYRDLVIRAKDRAVRSGRWKLVYMPMEIGKPRLALFDLSKDPACNCDVMDQHPEVASALRRTLFAWIGESDCQGPAVVPECAKVA